MTKSTTSTSLRVGKAYRMHGPLETSQSTGLGFLFLSVSGHITQSLANLGNETSSH